MSALQQPIDRSGPARSGDEGRVDLPPTSLPIVQPEADPVSPDGAVNGVHDGGGDGAGDPAFDFFRQDAIRQGFVGPDGFAQYLKQYGILSDSKQRRIREKEITGLDLDSSDPLDGREISRLEVTDSELG